MAIYDIIYIYRICITQRRFLGGIGICNKVLFG
jgi:hypothetical protein